MGRWTKNGGLDRIFEQIQREQIVRVKVEAVLMDSAIVECSDSHALSLSPG